MQPKHAQRQPARAEGGASLRLGVARRKVFFESRSHASASPQQRVFVERPHRRPELPIATQYPHDGPLKVSNNFRDNSNARNSLSPLNYPGPWSLLREARKRKLALSSRHRLERLIDAQCTKPPADRACHLGGSIYIDGCLKLLVSWPVSCSVFERIACAFCPSSPEQSTRTSAEKIARGVEDT